MKFFTFLIFVFIFNAAISFPQDSGEWKFSGQIQLRSELDGRDFRNKTRPVTFASLRTRAGVEKTVLGKVNFFAQIQDSRIFGEEQNTLASIDNIDLHQGYVTLKNLFDLDLDIQAGRFEVVYGTERFFGAVGWHYIGRSWDGVRFKFYPGFNLDLFALTHSESASYISNPVPDLYPDDPHTARRVSVYGFWGSFKIMEIQQLDVFGYYEYERADLRFDRYTLGLNHFGTYANLSTITEAAYQFGTQGTFDIIAYLISFQASMNFEPVKIGGGVDVVSGTKFPEDFADSELHHFNPRFGTNHKFYGYMDYFINFPQNTEAAGLNDFYLNFSFIPEESKWNFLLDVHYFETNKAINIILIDRPEGIDKSVLGQEIDLTVKYNFIKGTVISWGGSLFIPGELIRDYFWRGDDTAFWSYIMITANL